MAFWIQDIQHELGITVLMVEHDMTLVSKVSDRVLAMNMGEVLATGTPREVQADARVIEAYLGTVDDVSSLRPGGMSTRLRTVPWSCSFPFRGKAGMGAGRAPIGYALAPTPTLPQKGREKNRGHPHAPRRIAPGKLAP
jgi:ABC-type antimicrobial peptide transport system ATPase subunit